MKITCEQNVLRYGAPEPLPKHLELRAGPLTMIFEPGNAFLRRIMLKNTEVLRGIYAALRDHNWGTIDPQISALKIDQKNDAFTITFRAVCIGEGVDFLWNGTITGEADGTVCYTFDGRARSGFRRNRIGFCVLHPIEPCAGKPIRIVHADGTEEAGFFPEAISPGQPFMDIRSISHAVGSTLKAEICFEGDVFEMEDQRNWTDASFKTYCTPLGLPFPVEVRGGDEIHQSVTLRLLGETVETASSQSENEGVKLTVGKQAVVLPALGVSVASHGQSLIATEIDRLRSLRLNHLRVDLYLNKAGWMGVLKNAAGQAGAIETSLEAAIFVSDNADEELSRLVETLREVQPQLSRFLLFHTAEKSTTDRWIELGRRILRTFDRGIPIAAGTNAYFAELNRSRPNVDLADMVTYSINPQVHAFDNDSLVETLQSQGYAVQSARRFAGETPVIVSPVTFAPRFNPNATGPEPTPPPSARYPGRWIGGRYRYSGPAGRSEASNISPSRGPRASHTSKQQGGEA